MKYVFLSLIALLFAGCASDPLNHADAIAGTAGLHRTQVQTKTFLLTAYVKISDRTKPVDVYIEGDGLAWLSEVEPSPNPTPRKAMGLSLAAADPAANVVYIARPCQFTSFDRDPHCDVAYWTDRRFSEEVIGAMNQAVEALTRSAEDRKLNLVGYSGGGAVAVLIAARRHDVVSVRTIAGNLDHVEVNRQNDVTPLSGSLNAIDYAREISRIPQVHFSGQKDDVVTPVIAKRFLKASAPTNCITLYTLESATHETGWPEHWPGLLKVPPTCDR